MLHSPSFRKYKKKGGIRDCQCKIFRKSRLCTNGSLGTMSSKGSQNSILNQKTYLESYSRQQGFSNLRHFTDDGYSGINFNRPGFAAMVREIEAGNVGTVIVKDMSRFGRNYLQVGFYTEIMFPDKGVRFIAVNNSIDSAKPQENDFTPFLNIMNEFYSRDTSNKIKAIFRARMQDGKRCSGSVPYGYVRSSSDKQTLVVDPEAAQVVRQIFDLACQGMGAAKIADFLCESQVLIPSAYQRLRHPEYCRNDYRNPYRWSGNTVNTILSRREYLGETILGKSVCENFKTKKRRAATPEELLVFPTPTKRSLTRRPGTPPSRCESAPPEGAPMDPIPTGCPVWCTAPTAVHGSATMIAPEPDAGTRPMTQTWAFSAATMEIFTTTVPPITSRPRCWRPSSCGQCSR